MPQYPLRVNLASPLFPFATELWGRSIIVPQFDQNFDRTTLNAPGVTVDKGIPQAFYMHNCLPTPQGYQAIGYTNGLPPNAGNTLPPNPDFDQVFSIQQPDGHRFLFSPSIGKNFIYDATINTWIVSTPTPGVDGTTLVTVAMVQGQSYIYYEKIGAFKYDPVAQTMVPVTLTGLDVTKVIGIASANGYMIAWTTVNVAWSSLLNSTDFTPDLTTGAGGGAINDASGDIRVCLPIAGGFIVYCDLNAVGARYSGNINFPFVFKEVPGSGGIRHPNDVSYHSNLAYHILWSGNGLQQLTLVSTIPIYVEATDFLAGQIFEDFDDASLTFSTSYLSSPLNLHITIISARFMVISYGMAAPDFTHALVFDLALSRWGKLKITHRQCFQFTFPNLVGAQTYGDLILKSYHDLLNTTYGDLNSAVANLSQDEFKHNFAFLQANGTVKIVDFSFSEGTANGVLMLGKYQFQRAQRIEHQVAEFDVVQAGANNFNYFIVPTQDGKTLGKLIPGFLTLRADRTIVYKKIVNAYSLAALFTGQFNLTSITFIFTMGGYIK
jgi:hypothetical protein